MGCGLFTEEMIEGLQKLLARADVDMAAVKDIVRSLPNGAPERYLGAVNELLKTQHAFGDMNVLRSLVDHPNLQTLLLEDGTNAFTGLMKAANGDVARADRHMGGLQMLKRQALEATGEAGYQKLLTRLAAGEQEVQSSLRQARRVQQIAGGLAPDLQELVLSAVRTADRKAFNTARDTLVKRVAAVHSAQDVKVFEGLLLSGWRREQMMAGAELDALSAA